MCLCHRILLCPVQGVDACFVMCTIYMHMHNFSMILIQYFTATVFTKILQLCLLKYCWVHTFTVTIFAAVEGITDLKYDARNFVTADGQQITLIIRDDGCYLCANNITTILPQFNRSFLEKKRGMRYVNANRLEIELLKQRGLVAKKACRAALYSAKTIVDICYSSSVQPPSFIVDFACEKVQWKRDISYCVHIAYSTCPYIYT